MDIQYIRSENGGNRDEMDKVQGTISTGKIRLLFVKSEKYRLLVNLYYRYS